MDQCGIGLTKKSMKIIFSDNGCGIAPDDLNRIFDPFFTTKGLPHAGLGLILAKKIVASHLGIILVESKVNQGTKVIVELPVEET